MRAQLSVGMGISTKRFDEVARLQLVNLKIKIRRVEVSNKKYKKFTCDINKQLNPHFGALEIKKITANQISMFFDKLRTG